MENVASMRNRGFDITLGVDILKTRDFSWSVSGNLNYNKNEITKLFNGLDEYTLPDTGLKIDVYKRQTWNTAGLSQGYAVYTVGKN